MRTTNQSDFAGLAAPSSRDADELKRRSGLDPILAVLACPQLFFGAAFLVADFIRAAFLVADFFGGAFLAWPSLRSGFFTGLAGGSSLEEYFSNHSSITTQVVVRAARPVSMPRCPPGTISKRTSGEFVSSGTSALTDLIGAMPSVFPAKTNTGRPAHVSHVNGHVQLSLSLPLTSSFFLTIR
jgi:hypothetical protein